MQFEKFDLGHLNLSVTGLDFHQLSELNDITAYVVTVISVSSLHLQVEITNLWHSIQRNHRNLYRLSLSIETKNISLLLVLPPVALKVPNCSYHIELDLQQPSGKYFTFVIFSASITFGFKLRKCTLQFFRPSESVLNARPRLSWFKFNISILWIETTELCAIASLWNLLYSVRYLEYTCISKTLSRLDNVQCVH